MRRTRVARAWDDASAPERPPGWPRRARKWTRPKTVTIGVRLTPELWAAVQRVAALTGRSGGALLAYAGELYILRNYPKAMDKRAKLTLALVEAAVEKRRLAGMSRAESLTPERRREIARTAAEARWHRRDIQ